MMVGSKAVIFGNNSNMKFTKQIIAKSILLSLVTSLAMLLSGCSAYSSSFGCGDSKGATCMPMDKVDKLIASGEIERFTKERDGECKWGRCKKRKTITNDSDELPEIQSVTPEFKQREELEQLQKLDE